MRWSWKQEPWRWALVSSHLFQPSLSHLGEQEALTPLHSANSLCTALSTLHPLSVHFPHTTSYATQQSSYFSAQQTADYHPACRISPTSATEVSLTIRALVAANVPFAIKSGGHSYVPGLSNTNGNGITIDLSSLASVALSPDKSTVCLGVGTTWSSIYLFLETQGLSVAGSRAGSVGAGGYLLGGGFSWLASQIGWACDSVEEFEVVLANGNVVLANTSHHENLFWALKGGGSSFGIVTQVRMLTTPVGAIYGGIVAYEPHYLDELIEALVNMNAAMNSESSASGFLTFAGIPNNPYAIMSSAYLVDLGGRENSPLLGPLLKIPYMWNSLRTMNISDSAAEISEDGERLRQVKFTLTLHSDISMLKMLYDLFVAFAGPMLSGTQPADLVAMTLQPLSSSHLSWRDNALGFPSPSEPPSEPLMLLSLDARWTSPTDDAYMERQVRRIYTEMREGAQKERGLHRFVYMNYAAGWQSPWDGYGDVSKKRLQDVKEKYDPGRVFERLTGGGRYG